MSTLPNYHPVAHSDFLSMQVATRTQRQKKWVPQFAYNQQQMRHVIIVRAWNYAYGGVLPMPPIDQIDYAMLNAACTAKACGSGGYTNAKSHSDAVVARGGYMQLQTAIAYRSWNLFESSTTIAGDLGLTPIVVRQILNRMVMTARKLGYETFQKHWTADILAHREKDLGRDGRRLRLDDNTVAQIISMRRAGSTTRQIADALHINRERIRPILKDAGLLHGRGVPCVVQHYQAAIVDEARVLELFKSGMTSYQAIARAVGVYYTTAIKRILKHNGLYEKRKHGRPRKQMDVQLIAALSGLPVEQVRKNLEA